METINSEIVEEDGKHFIEIKFQPVVRIPLTEDKPNIVKEAFNQLVMRLKDGKFNIELHKSKEDLFYLVAEEYIKQLNSELSEVYSELEHYDLLD